MKKKFLVLSTSLALLFLSSPHASAHASITNANPKPNAVLAQMPKEVWIEFDGNLQTLGDKPINFLVVTDENGKRLDSGSAQVAGARLYATIVNQPSAQKISLDYRVVSEDGHPIEGKLNFSVNTIVEEIVATPSTKPSVIKKSASPTPLVSESNSPSPETTVKSPLVDEHADHNFFERHRTHFIQFGFGALIIFMWWIYDRRKRNSIQ